MANEWEEAVDDLKETDFGGLTGCLVLPKFAKSFTSEFKEPLTPDNVHAMFQQLADHVLNYLNNTEGRKYN